MISKQFDSFKKAGREMQRLFDGGQLFDHRDMFIKMSHDSDGVKRFIVSDAPPATIWEKVWTFRWQTSGSTHAPCYQRFRTVGDGPEEPAGLYMYETPLNNYWVMK